MSTNAEVFMRGVMDGYVTVGDIISMLDSAKNEPIIEGESIEDELERRSKK